jgi:hypothetical protein
MAKKAGAPALNVITKVTARAHAASAKILQILAIDIRSHETIPQTTRLA